MNVSYTDGFGQIETIGSDPTTLIANVNDSSSGTITIVGTPEEDKTLYTKVLNLTDEDGFQTNEVIQVQKLSEVTHIGNTWLGTIQECLRTSSK